MPDTLEALPRRLADLHETFWEMMDVVDAAGRAAEPPLSTAQAARLLSRVDRVAVEPEEVAEALTNGVDPAALVPGEAREGVA